MTGQNVLLAVLVHLLASSLPSDASAQNAAAPRVDSGLDRAVTRISSDVPRSVRLVSHRIGRVKGDRVYLRGDSLLVLSARQSRAVALEDIDSLWVQRGSAARMLGIAAAVPCAVYGGLLGAFLATDPDNLGRPGRGPAGALTVGALGGVICGSLGAAIGSSFKRWRLEYARPPEAAA